MWAPVHMLAALLLIQLSDNKPGKSVENGPTAWVPATLVGDLDETPSSWLPSGPALATVNQQLKHLPLSVSPLHPLCL